MRYAFAMLAVAGCGAGVKPIVDGKCFDGSARAVPPPPNPYGGNANPNRSTAPREVEQDVVEGHRISGEKSIHPDLPTMRWLHQNHVDHITMSVRICIDEKGVPSMVDLLSPSCYPRYEETIHSKMLEWRYSPYMVDGVRVPVCTAVSFFYRQG
ncbi:MAG TPA: hypothetical protein VGM90_00225 [Kofleriaceae bacterium]|jgi:hypothetical protein